MRYSNDEPTIEITPDGHFDITFYVDGQPTSEPTRLTRHAVMMLVQKAQKLLDESKPKKSGIKWLRDRLQD